MQSLQQRNSENGDERESFGSENFPPSIFELNYELEKLTSQGDGCNTSMAVISSLQYYDQYCIDCCGLPLIDCNPNISDGWNIPKYEQVYFSVLPQDEETPRVKIKQSRACFNCGNFGHNVQDCPEPRDFARISANKREFVNKFVSPITGNLKSTKSRYHGKESVEKRFEEFKPGTISDNLKEALGLGQEDLPLYIYRMRYRGYPPGYLPKAARPSLLLYDGDGNIDDYMVEEDDVHISLIEYPGFNVPLPEGEIFAIVAFLESLFSSLKSFNSGISENLTIFYEEKIEFEATRLTQTLVKFQIIFLLFHHQWTLVKLKQKVF